MPVVCHGLPSSCASEKNKRRGHPSIFNGDHNTVADDRISYQWLRYQLEGNVRLQHWIFSLVMLLTV